MELVTQFIENYKKRLPFYEAAGRLAASQLEAALQAAGIRAMVTSRVKSPDRLQAKVLRRNEHRQVPFKNMREIYDDIADLCGIRVSLYFPGDRDKTGDLLEDLFEIQSVHRFPEQSKAPTYNRRFSGYWATHYRAILRPELLTPAQARYASVRLEIQVASLLMHAWSEVEHDLVYKPLQGNLSEEELAIIDELNGLVLSGEIALERLQKAGNARILSKESFFDNQYDLAAYLYNYLSSHFRKEDVELRMGDIQLLYQLISRLGVGSVKALEPVIRSVKFEKDKRNISQQIIDQLISGNREYYRTYLELRAASRSGGEDEIHAINRFLESWVTLEALLNRVAGRGSSRGKSGFNINSLKRQNLLDPDTIGRFASLRRLRNVLIHDIEIPPADVILKNALDLEELLKKLQEMFGAA